MRLPSFIALICCAAGTAQAQEYSAYNSLDIRYERLNIDFDAQTLTADGYAVLFSRELANNFSIVSSYKHYDFDNYSFLGYGPKQELFDIGLGYHYPLTSNIDAYGNLRYGVAESNLGDGDISSYGALAEAGLRIWLPYDWEFDTSLHYTGYEDPISLTGPEMSLNMQAVWQMNDVLGFSIGGNIGEYESAWFGSFRFRFDGLP